AVASCRRIWSSFTDERSRRAIETAERFAEGQATFDELDEACNSARHAAWEVRWDLSREAAWTATWRLLHPETVEDPEGPEQDSGVIRAFGCAAGERSRGGKVGAAVEHQAQADLLRDIVGNPFRPAPLDLFWRTPRVVRLAQTISEQLAFDRTT